MYYLNIVKKIQVLGVEQTSTVWLESAQYVLYYTVVVANKEERTRQPFVDQSPKDKSLNVNHLLIYQSRDTPRFLLALQPALNLRSAAIN